MPQEVGKQRLSEYGRGNPPCQRPQRTAFVAETQGVAAHPKSGGQYPGQHGLSDNGSGGTERGDLYNQPDESKPEIPSGNGNAVKVRR